MAANLLKNNSSFVQMVILSSDRQKVPLTRTEAYEFEKYLFEELVNNLGKSPLCSGQYVFSEVDGAIIINTHVDSVNCLKSMICWYNKKALTITDIKNSPQYTALVNAVVPWIDNLLVLLEAHNDGLQTGGWRITNIHHKPLSERCDITLLIDDLGREMLEKNGFKLFIGFETVSFELVGKVKRCETTGKICVHDLHSQED